MGSLSSCEYLGRSHSSSAEFPDAEGIVALGESAAVLIEREFAVEPVWIRIPKGALKKNLPGCGFEKVRSANNLAYSHCEVVGDAGELVTRNAIASPDEEVAKVEAGDEALRTEVEIFKFNSLAVRDAEAPVELCRNLGKRGREIKWAIPAALWAAGARVNGLVIGFIAADAWTIVEDGAFMGSAKSGKEVLAGAATGVNESAVAKFLPRSVINISTATLFVRSAASAAIRSFVPAEAQPAEVFESGLHVLRAGAIVIEILHAHNQLPMGLASSLPGAVECAGVADVEIAGG